MESPDAKEWLAFGPEVLGMEAVEAASGSVLLRIDDADHRIGRSSRGPQPDAVCGLGCGQRGGA
ncbi:hypothetical protein [Mycolicibacterium sp. D3]